MKQPFEIVPLMVAASIGAFVMLLLVDFFDSTNAKVSTYILFGAITGVGVQLLERVTGVS